MLAGYRKSSKEVGLSSKDRHAGISLGREGGQYATSRNQHNHKSATHLRKHRKKGKEKIMNSSSYVMNIYGVDKGTDQKNKSTNSFYQNRSSANPMKIQQ